MLAHAPSVLTIAGVIAWGVALLLAPLPPYLDQQTRHLMRIGLGVALFGAATVTALWQGA